MTTPPATRIPLGASWWYRSAVLFFATILIAACAINTRTTGIFDTENGVLWLLAGLAIAWALWDAWRSRRGVLHYAQGQWVLALGDVEYEGTIYPVIDLPRYLLVKFTPVHAQSHPMDYSSDKNSYKNEYSPQCPERWLHLEPHSKLSAQRFTQADAQPPLQMSADAATAADWLALRRAVFARAQPRSAHPAHS